MKFANHCIACRGHKPGESVGVYSMISIHANFSLAGAIPNGPPGIVTAMTEDAPAQSQRAADLVRKRDEYRRLLQDAAAGQAR